MNNNGNKSGNKNDEFDLGNKKRKIDENSILSEVNSDRAVEMSVDMCAIPLKNTTKRFTEFESTRNVESVVNTRTGTTTSASTTRWLDPPNGDFKYLNVLLPSGRDIKLKMHSKDSDVLKYVNEI